MPKRESKRSAQLANQPYEKFLRSVRLVALGLSKCECRLDRGAYIQASRKKGLTRVNAEHKVHRTGDGHFDVLGSISVALEDPEKKLQVLSVSCSFEAHFHAEFAADSPHPGRFADGEARLILFPYFREFVSDLTGRMAIRPVFLPLATEE